MDQVPAVRLYFISTGLRTWNQGHKKLYTKRSMSMKKVQKSVAHETKKVWNIYCALHEEKMIYWFFFDQPVGISYVCFSNSAFLCKEQKFLRVPYKLLLHFNVSIILQHFLSNYLLLLLLTILINNFIQWLLIKAIHRIFSNNIV